MSEDAIVIKKIEKPQNTPTAALIAAGVAELAERGFGYCAPGWDVCVLYAEQVGGPYHGQVLGVLCWNVSDWMQEAQIALGYVRPEYRRQGIYSRLFAALEAEATALKLRAITGYTHADNTQMQLAAVRQGREVFVYGYRKMMPVEVEVVSEPEVVKKPDTRVQDHLDACVRCREQPFNLCAVGTELLTTMEVLP